MGVKYSQLPNAGTISPDDQVAILDVSETILKKTSVSHAVTYPAFGMGDQTRYGHNKLVDNLGSTFYDDGLALSAHQGNVLANLVGIVETGDAAAYAHSQDDLFIWKGQLVRALSNISIGATINSGNVQSTSVSEAIKSTTVAIGVGLTRINGAVCADFGSTANKVCEGNDPRLSNPRTPTSHDQPASTITAGTFDGQVKADSTAEATLNVAQLRNAYISDADITAGTTSLTTGEFYIVYE